ncbi:MAG: hypothetical protein ABJK11_02055 [Balneola sp.]
MKHHKKNITSVTLLSMLILAGIFVYNCDNTLSPVLEGESIYTVYGILDLDKQRNFIRVNDIKTQSNSEEELELDVNVSLTNLNTSFTEILRDSLIIYDGDIATHNFYTENPIQFNTDYRVIIKDSLDNEINILTSTPVETNTLVEGEDRKCFQYFFIEIEGIDRSKDEFIDFEVGFEFRDRMVWGISRDHIDTYFEETNTLRLGFTPNQIISDVSGPGNEFSCVQLSSNIMHFRYVHFGGFEQGQVITDESGDLIPGSRIVIGKYTRQLEIRVETDEFINSLPC